MGVVRGVTGGGRDKWSESRLSHEEVWGKWLTGQIQVPLRPLSTCSHHPPRMAMAVQPPVAPAAQPAFTPPARTFVPLHKLRRRTATSVCAGAFDEVATPRGALPKYTPLAGVENINWMRAVRKEHERQGYILPAGAYALMTDIAGVGGGKHKERIAHRRALYANEYPYAAYPSYLDNDEEDDDVDELNSDLDDDDDLGPMSALPPTPGRSVASSVTSRTSSRRPHTPFDLDLMSPTTSVSPTFPPISYPFPPPLARRYTAGDLKGVPTAGKSQGKTRPRADSMTSDLDVPLAKRAKTERPGLSKAPSAGAQGSQKAHVTTSAEAARRRKSSARKGWKGWVEVEDDTPQPPTLIKLDAPAPILPERRTRSGKNFDGIGVGDGSWI